MTPFLAMTGAAAALLRQESAGDATAAPPAAAVRAAFGCDSIVAFVAIRDGDAGLVAALAAAAKAWPGFFTLRVFVSPHARITAADIAAVDAIADRDVYFCGSARLRGDLLKWLAAAGVAGEKLHTESFDF